MVVEEAASTTPTDAGVLSGARIRGKNGWEVCVEVRQEGFISS